MSTIPKTKDEVIAACEKTLSLAPDEYPHDLPTEENLNGAPGWYAFEYDAWVIGEAIRQALKKNHKLKKDKDLTLWILKVAKNRNLRRGRQPFFMNLGFVGAKQHAFDVAQYLGDPDVSGHIIDTLLKMGVGGFREKVEPFIESKKAWIRNLAKRYVARYPERA